MLVPVLQCRRPRVEALIAIDLGAQVHPHVAAAASGAPLQGHARQVARRWTPRPDGFGAARAGGLSAGAGAGTRHRAAPGTPASAAGASRPSSVPPT